MKIGKASFLFARAKLRAPRINGTSLLLLKRKLYRRQKGICAACHRAEAEQLDHIVPIEQGGTDAEYNVHLLCSACHRTKTALQRGARVRELIGPDGYPIQEDVPGAINAVIRVTPVETLRPVS